MSFKPPTSGEYFEQIDPAGGSGIDPIRGLVSSPGGTEHLWVPREHDDDTMPRSFFALDSIALNCFNGKFSHEALFSEFCVTREIDPQTKAITLRRNPEPLTVRDDTYTRTGIPGTATKFPGGMKPLCVFVKENRVFRMPLSEYDRLLESCRAALDADAVLLKEQAAWHEAEALRLEQGRKERANPSSELGKAIAQGVAAALHEMGIRPQPKGKAAQ